MAASEIGLLSMTQIQNLSQSQSPSSSQHQPNPNSSATTTTTTTSSSATWMWNPSRENCREEEEDDSWEVRAFAEDTRNIMGTTWPPRSYTCTFCRREFRSAQALGGHMNVHRRDRARLHQVNPPPPIPTPPFINIPPQEQLGLCLLYHLPSPSNSATFTTVPNINVNGESPSPSTLLSISPYQPNNFMMQTCPPPSFNLPLARQVSPQINGSFSSYVCNSTKMEQPATSRSIDNGHLEELDLELRLGHKPTPT